MMVPFQVLLTPQYIMITRLGWNDTLVGLIVPYMMNTLYIFMSRQFYLSFPGDLLEAARVDGLGFFRSFFHIVLPPVQAHCGHGDDLQLCAELEFVYGALHLCHE